MLCQSNLTSFNTSKDTEHLITTLFADNTTDNLSKTNKYKDLQNILDTWCRASGAKFNTQKTIILPLGTPEFRQRVIQTRSISGTPNHNLVSSLVHIAQDGTPVRILGAFVGNKVEKISIWTPTIEKINTVLKYWGKSHPTQDGRHLIIGMEVGGLTQYLTRVQGMPAKVESTIKNIIKLFM
ncbi:hypothetical protein B0H34DRAFT_665865 [Crassisporium funariophilum]|nr:hypothetical protein B0H34DRAFT_665865 [Crassisporium funariophilum]